MVAWNAFMDKYYPGGDKTSTFPAYAYAVTSTLVEVLKRAGDNLTRENVMKQAASMKGVEIPLLLPGIKINTSATDFYPIQSVQYGALQGRDLRAVRQHPVRRGGVAAAFRPLPVRRAAGPLQIGPSGIPCPVGFSIQPHMTTAPAPAPLSAALVSGDRTP